jgi:hypothetical protein
VLLVHDRGQTVAGALLTAFNGTVTYECGAASVPTGGEALLQAASRWGSEAGMRSLALCDDSLSEVSERRLETALGAHRTAVDHIELRDGPPRPRPGAHARWAAPFIRRGPALVARAFGETRYPLGA